MQISEDDLVEYIQERHEQRSASDAFYSNDIQTGRGPRFANHSPTIENMDAPTRAGFVIETAFDRIDHHTVADAYAGETYEANATDGVKLLLFEDTQMRVSEGIDSGDRPVTAFNRHTDNWPHQLRAEYAAYEYHEGGRDDDNYVSELRSFAESEGVLDMDFVQTELDTFYEANAFDDERLSEEEARAVMMARHYELDTNVSEIDFSEINEVDDFVWWLKETEDVETAMRSHHFGTDVPTKIISQAAAPSDWDTLDPSDIETAEYVGRPAEAYYIHHHEVGETWVTESGPFDGERVGDYSDRLADSSGNDPAERRRVLPASEEEQMSGDVIVATDGDVVTKFMRSHSIVCHDYGRITDLVDDVQDGVALFAEGEPMNQMGLVDISPQGQGNATMEAQRDAMSYIITESPDTLSSIISDGIGMVWKQDSISGTSYYILFSRDNPEAARNMKQFLEHPEEYAPVEVPA